MKKLSVLIIIQLGILLPAFPQNDIPSARNSLTMVFYNVENLFDTVDDTLTNDDEFTPDSPKEWDDQKYQAKLADLAEVLSSVNDRELPSVIGLAEIENRAVLDDLANERKLRRAKYRVIHFDSRDERGIDVALLYNPSEIELLDSRAIPVEFNQDTQDFTRDILYARIRTDDGKTCHVFVNHWPSRSPDQDNSEIKRITAAIALRKEVDLIFNNDKSARIIIMGDFNDEPTNRSLLQILNATNKRKNIYYRDLFNLMYDIHNISGEGSITYNGAWQMFDQIIVSYPLFVKGADYYLTYGDGRIFRDEKIIKEDAENGSESPDRTYSGNTYTGGASDHLPVYIILRKERN